MQSNADPDAIATIVYTSGSSGRPKGVCLTHRNLYTVAQSVCEHMPISSEDSYLMVVPLHYVHGLMQLLVHTHAGATIHSHESFVFPRKIVDRLQTTGATGFSGVPFHFNALVAKGNLLSAKLPALRWMTVTGGKLNPARIAEIGEKLPDVNFHVAYGQTECAPRATALDPSKVLSKPTSVGAPIPGVQVLILDDSGKEVEQGEIGEVVIAGDNVMKGYWDDPVGTAGVLDDMHRLHTGDLGRFDNEGDLFLVGRKSSMIKSAGERVIPEEIERLLTALPCVDDAVVVGVPDDMYGQRVVAHIQLASNAANTEKAAMSEKLRSLCLLSMPIARAPREFRFWKSFPRLASGKPDRVLISNARHDDE